MDRVRILHACGRVVDRDDVADADGTSVNGAGGERRDQKIAQALSTLVVQERLVQSRKAGTYLYATLAYLRFPPNTAYPS